MLDERHDAAGHESQAVRTGSPVRVTSATSSDSLRLAHVTSSDPASPRVVSFDGAPAEHDPDVRDIEQVIDGVRWAVVEYAPGAGRTEWCDSPHSGYVLTGELQYEFEDGSPEMRVAAGQAFRLPPAPAHRGRNHAGEPARLFIIDALPAHH
jgi:quercetin dioxygenase-like cupin family protein